MSGARRLAMQAAIPTVLLGVDVIFRPVPFGLAFRAWLVALGALAAADLVRRSLAPYRRVAVERVRFQPRRIAPSERPAGLEEVERAIDFAAWNPADLNRRLRPLLRVVAAHRLQTRRGIDLARAPGQARALLGETAWDLIDEPAAGEPAHRRSGATVAAMRDTIQRLEDL